MPQPEGPSGQTQNQAEPLIAERLYIEALEIKERLYDKQYLDQTQKENDITRYREKLIEAAKHGNANANIDIARYQMGYSGIDYGFKHNPTAGLWRAWRIEFHRGAVDTLTPHNKRFRERILYDPTSNSATNPNFDAHMERTRIAEEHHGEVGQSYDGNHRLVSLEIDFARTKDSKFVSKGASNRENIQLDKQSKSYIELLNRIKQKCESLEPKQNTKKILEIIIDEINEFNNLKGDAGLTPEQIDAGVDTRLEQFIHDERERQRKDNPALMNPVISMDTFMQEGLMVCRHKGLLSAAIMGDLVKEGILPKGSARQYRSGLKEKPSDSIDGAHTWSVFTESDGTMWMCDPRWGVNGTDYGIHNLSDKDQFWHANQHYRDTTIKLMLRRCMIRDINDDVTFSPELETNIITQDDARIEATIKEEGDLKQAVENCQTTEQLIEVLGQYKGNFEHPQGGEFKAEELQKNISDVLQGKQDIDILTPQFVQEKFIALNPRMVEIKAIKNTLSDILAGGPEIIGIKQGTLDQPDPRVIIMQIGSEQIDKKRVMALKLALKENNITFDVEEGDVIVLRGTEGHRFLEQADLRDKLKLYFDHGGKSQAELLGEIKENAEKLPKANRPLTEAQTDKANKLLRNINKINNYLKAVPAHDNVENVLETPSPQVTHQWQVGRKPSADNKGPDIRVLQADETPVLEVGNNPGLSLKEDNVTPVASKLQQLYHYINQEDNRTSLAIEDINYTEGTIVDGESVPSKMEIKFKQDDNKTVSAYASETQEGRVQFSVSRDTLNNDPGGARLALFNICRIAIDNAEPGAELFIPATLDESKREMIAECFEQALEEAFKKEGSTLTAEHAPKITDLAKKAQAEEPERSTSRRPGGGN